MSDGDSPAAHGRNIGWFAVDKCGHVALFRSGEAGAVPFHAWRSGYPEGDLEYPDIAAGGVFEYEHETDNRIAGPYRRLESPVNPVLFHLLPRNIGKKLTGIRFKRFCFLERGRIQPVEHAQCDLVVPAWLDLEGKTASLIRGHEYEHAHQYKERWAEDVDLLWDPPGESPGLMAWLKRLWGGKG